MNEPKALKPGWRMVKFGDVVRLSKARSQDPLADGFERYVGLEHLGPGDLRIRRWGNVADGVTFTNVFKPGQVLFGKRRAYQRKVAVADFGGICSGDIYVLESKDATVLLPDLLPFICQTDAFFEHAVGTSAGSLSPRTNWSSLANFEFMLPPPKEQQRTLSMLQIAEANIDAVRDAANSLEILRGSVSVNYFLSAPLADTVTGKSLVQRQQLSLQTGPFGSVLTASAYQGAGVPIINPVNITNGKLAFAEGPFVCKDDHQRLAKYWMSPGDIIIGRKRHMHKLVYVEAEHQGFIVGSDCIRFRVDKSTINPRYFFYFLKSDVTQHWLQAQAGGNGSVMPGMNERILERLEIYLPGIEKQEQIASEFSDIDAAEESLNARLTQATRVYKQLREALQLR